MSGTPEDDCAAALTDAKRGQERLVLGVFLASGFLALVFEICWIRKATLVFGSANYALSCVLAVFFGGLALGSFLFGKASLRTTRPLRVYGILEIAIAALVLLSPAMFALADRAYGAVYGRIFQSLGSLTFVRCLLLTVILLPPTVAMGGTFPLLCRYFVRSEGRVSRSIGRLFCLNTFGAALGAALCGFVLVPKVGVDASIYLGGALGGLMGFFVLRLPIARNPLTASAAEICTAESGGNKSVGETPAHAGARMLAMAMGLLFFVSGFVALGNEILWTRFLSLIVQRSVYTYTLVLTVILLGLALGSLGVSWFFDRSKTRGAWFGALQMLIGLSVLGALSMPSEFWMRWLDTDSLFEQAVMVSAMLLAPACLSGMAFPLAIRIVVSEARLAGWGAGRMTALNTLGGILGSLAFGFLLLPMAGMQTTLIVSTGVSLAAGAVALLLVERHLRLRWRLTIALLGVGAWCFLATGMKTRLPQDYLALSEQLLDFREGVNSFVSVTDTPSGDRQLKIDRLWQGFDRNGHQVMAAHIPMMLHPNPKSVAAVGVGAGQTPSRFLMYEIERLDCVEIEAETLALIRDYFESAWMDDPRARFIIDDGRNYLTHTSESYDVISIEVGQTYRPGVASFYTKEFYRAAGERLEPGGLVCQFLPIAFFSMEEIEMLTATFLAEFPESALWYNTAELLLVGCRDRPIVLHSARADMLATNDAVLTDLEFAYWGGDAYILARPEVFIGGFLLSKKGLVSLANGAKSYSDERPWLEYSTVRTHSNEADIVERIRKILDPVQPLLEFRPGAQLITASEVVRDKNLRDIVAMSLMAEVNSAASRGDAQGGEQTLREAINWNPDNIHLLQSQADLLSDSGQWEEAATIYGRVIRAKPDYAEAHSNLGNALAAMGRIDKAIASFREALRHKPGLKRARESLVRAEQFSGQSGGKIGELRAEVEARPETARARMDLARALFDSGDHLGAIEQYRAVLKLDSESAAALNDLAWALATVSDEAVRDGNEAVTLAERAMLMTGRGSPIAIGTLAAAHAAAGDFKKAIAFSQEAIALSESRGESILAERLRKRLKLFEEGRAIRQ